MLVLVAFPLLAWATSLPAGFESPLDKPLTDAHGDLLPPGAIARLGTSRFRHGVRVDTLAYSPDGKLLASGGQDGIALWDSASGKRLKKFAVMPVSYLAFSPDGKTFVSLSYRIPPMLWDVLTAQCLRKFGDAKGAGHLPSMCAALSPDGKLLACGGTKGLIIWEVSTGKKIQRITTAKTLRITFSPDSRFLAQCGWEDASIHLLEVRSGQEIRRFRGPLPDLVAVAFSPKDDLLAVSSFAGEVWIFQLPNRKPRFRLNAGQDVIDAVAFSPDGTLLASAARDGTICIWQAGTGKLRQRFSAPQPSRLAFSPDGKTLASGSWNCTIDLFDPATGKSKRLVEGHQGPLTFIAFAAGGKRLVTAGWDRRVCLWDISSSRQLGRFMPFPAGYTYGTALSPDEKTLASNGYVSDSQKPGKSVREVHLRDVASGKILRKMGKSNEFHSVVFSPDGKYLAGMTPGKKITLLDQATGKEVACLKKVDAGIMAFMPHGRAILWVNREAMVLQDWATGKQLRRFHVWDWRPDALAVSPDGRTAVTWSENDRWVRLVEVNTGRVRALLEKGSVTVGPIIEPVTFSSNGRVLAAASENKEVRLWDVTTGKVLTRLQGHEGEIQVLAFSRNGKMLASGSSDTTALVWDVTSWTKESKPNPFQLEAKDLQKIVQELGERDAARAYRAMWSLVAAGPQTVSSLGKILHPAPRLDETTQKTVARLIVDLDHPQFAVRNKATKELERLGERAEPALHQALKKVPSEEARRRIHGLLDLFDPATLTPERTLQVRALEALGHIASPEAQQLVARLAGGNPSAWFTGEARMTWEYLKQIGSQ